MTVTKQQIVTALRESVLGDIKYALEALANDDLDDAAGVLSGAAETLSSVADDLSKLADDEEDDDE